MNNNKLHYDQIEAYSKEEEEKKSLPSLKRKQFDILVYTIYF